MCKEMNEVALFLFEGTPFLDYSIRNCFPVKKGNRTYKRIIISQCGTTNLADKLNNFLFVREETAE